MYRRLSLLYVTVTTTRGGVEEHILTLLRGLSRERFDLHLSCPSALLDALSPDLPRDVAVLPIVGKPRGTFAEEFRLARYLRQHRIDIVHSHMFHSSLFASPIAWLCGVPAVIETSHGREAWRTGWKSNFVIDRFVNRFVDATIAVSEANRRFLISAKRLPARNLTVIPNGCDLEKFRPDPAARRRLRAELGLAPETPVLLVAGRLEPQKGHRVLLDALPAVRNEFPSVQLICVGEGSLRPELEAQARRLALDGSVRFAGFHANVSEWYAMADVCVLPSFYEGLPLAAIEALGAGCPMVATAVDGTVEVVLDGGTGLTVPCGDSAAMARAIGRLLRDPGLRTRLAGAGRAWVLRGFDQREQIRRTEALYESVVAARQRRHAGPSLTAEVV